jgi:methylmalonyl-CoA/ethylmalonyl-CoA epimerase
MNPHPDASPAGMEIHLDTLGQIAVTVSNLERSRDFYRDVLGMQFLFETGNMAFFQCGAIRFMIGTADHPVEPGGTILYFRVPDIHAAHAALAAKGVVFLQKPQRVARLKEHELWMAFLSDPDRNTFALMCEIPHRDEPAAEAA